MDEEQPLVFDRRQTVGLRFTVDVPAGTDPQFVRRTLQSSLDDDDGRACQWGEWSVGPVQLAPGATREPEVEVFRRSGTWHKPPGAVEADVVVVGASSGDGTPGEVRVHTLRAPLPETVLVEVGAGGRGGAGAVWPASVVHGGGPGGEYTHGPWAATGGPPAPPQPGMGGGGGGALHGGADGLVVVISRFGESATRQPPDPKGKAAAAAVLRDVVGPPSNAMLDARLDQLVLRVEDIERRLGIDDE